MQERGCPHDAGSGLSLLTDLADQLGALEFVREKTLTCYNGIKADGCGECPACKLRKRGLDEYLNSKVES